MTDSTIGRDRELDAIASFLELGQHEAQILLLEGEAGIGKTTLWDHAIVAAEPARRVLRASPREVEARISFASIGDLLGDAVGEVASDLPGPQRQALERALLLTGDDGPEPEPQAIAFSCLTAFRLIARDRPVLVAVDDVQWLDRPSASVLAYASRRLRGEELRFLFARRIDGTPDVLGLDRTTVEDGLVRIDVGPLSAGATQRLVRERLDMPLTRPLLHRIHTDSGGNPFYALELARARTRVGARGGIGAPLAIPESLAGLVAGRLEALPGETIEALGVAALLTEPTVELVTAILEHPPTLVPAIDAGIIEVDGDHVGFTHPLLASSLASRIEPARAKGIHRRVAALVVDPEERARHLAAGVVGADPEVAAALDRGAAHARRRGAPEIAAELLERALEHTAEQAADRYDRLLAASDATRLAGDWARAKALAEAAAAVAAPGDDRARALLFVGLASSDALDVCLRALDEDVQDPALEARIQIALSDARLGRSLPLAHADACAALDAAVRSKDASIESQALALVAWLEGALAIGEPEATLDRAARLEHETDDRPSAYTTEFNLATLRMWRDQHDHARVSFEAQLERTLQAGDLYGQMHARLHLAQVEWRAGAWERASQHATEGLEEWPADELQGHGALLWVAGVIAVHQGKLDDARAMVDEALATAAYDHLFEARNLWVLGVASLRGGDVESALDTLEQARGIFAELGIVEPGMLLYVPDLIDAYVVAGRLDDAGELSSAFERQGDELGRPRASAIGARGRGLVHAAQGELDRAAAALADALAVNETWRVPLERGRTLLALGATQRRARHRREARATLEQARALFDELGAEPFAAQARAELGRIGGRAPSDGELTPTEEQVAALVVEGMTNKEAAASLVVSVHTVEAALTSIYRKLQVRSRTELAHKLAGRA